jgi:glycosyltransferase involved in cell wall biosynthesis
MNGPTLSIVVPMYNEEAVLDAFFDRMLPVLEAVGESFEIIFVDDGSRDRSVEIVLDRRVMDPRIKLISLSRNFGKENALTAGLDHAGGQAVIPVDADLQDPPELIADFVAKWREGYEVVYGVRTRRDRDTKMKRMSARMFYSLMRRLVGFEMPADAGDFRLMDRRVVDALGELREQNRFMKGLFAWVGFRQIGVPYERPERAAGMTKFGYWRLWNFALDGFTGFTTLPLRLAGYVGMLTAFVAVLYGGFLVARTIVSGVDVPGYASLMVAVLFLGGLQLIVLGVIGEYLGRSFSEAKQRPLYITREVVGFETAASAAKHDDTGTVDAPAPDVRRRAKG